MQRDICIYPLHDKTAKKCSAPKVSSHASAREAESTTDSGSRMYFADEYCAWLTSKQVPLRIASNSTAADTCEWRANSCENFGVKRQPLRGYCCWSRTEVEHIFAEHALVAQKRRKWEFGRYSLCSSLVVSKNIQMWSLRLHDVFSPVLRSR